MSNDKNLISVIIPCYCSANWIPELVDRILASTNRPTEIILVNDASPDAGETWNAIKSLDIPNVSGIDLQFNTGQFSALLCGMDRAKGDVIVTMDDDLQHPPEEIQALLSVLNRRPDLDCVIGRYQTKKHGVIRNLGSSLVRAIYHRASGKPKHLTMGSFRAMRRSVAEAMVRHRTNRPVFGPILLASTKRIENVDIQHHARPYGKSGYRLRQLVRTTLDNLFDATTAPLRAFSIMGILIAMGSAGFGVAYLYRYLEGGIGVPGFTTNVLLISFFGGITLLGLGLIGEYIDRIVREVRGPPRWHIRETTGSDSDTENKGQQS